MRNRIKKTAKKFGIHMVLILLTIVSIGPVGLVVINSMKPHAMIVKNPLSFPTTIEIANFKTAWEAGNLAVGFKNSILMTICSVIIAVFASFLAGYALSGNRMKHTSPFIIYFMVSMTIPLQLFLFPLFFIYAKLKLVGNIYAVSVILAATNIPMSVFLMRTAFLSIPDDLESAARIDGASTIQVLRWIMLPLMSPAFITVSIVVGLNVWKNYLIVSTFLQGKDNYTAPMGLLSLNGTYTQDQGVMMAGALMLIGPILIFFLALQKYFIEGIVGGAVKG